MATLTRTFPIWHKFFMPRPNLSQDTNKAGSMQPYKKKQLIINLTNCLKYLCVQLIIVLIWQLAEKKHGLLYAKKGLTGTALNILETRQNRKDRLND